MLTTFRSDGFPNTNFWFLGLTIFGLDLLCKSLGEAVRPGCPPVGPALVQQVASPLFCCPPSDKALQDQQARGGQTACGGRLDRVGRSDRLYGAVRPVYRDQPAVDLRTSTREGPHQS
jgi:hypothetical protein